MGNASEEIVPKMKLLFVFAIIGLTAMSYALPLSDEELIEHALMAFGDPNEPNEIPRANLKRNAYFSTRNQLQKKSSGFKERQNRQFFEVNDEDLINDALFAFGGPLF